MFSSQQAIEFWNDEAENFLSVSSRPNSFYHKRNEIIAELACKYAHSGTALDVGAAEGDLVIKLCELGFIAYGTDISRQMIMKAMQRLPDGASRFRLTQGSTLPFVEKFDLLTVIGVLPYVNGHKDYVEYLGRMLNKNAVLIITCTNPFSFYNFGQALRHLSKLRFNRTWWLQWKNMWRTGLRSGGFVNLKDKQQVHSMRALKKLLVNYEILETASFYNIAALDNNLIFANWFGWTHLVVARKLY